MPTDRTIEDLTRAIENCARIIEHATACKQWGEVSDARKALDNLNVSLRALEEK
jgi:hypothetical protein